MSSTSGGGVAAVHGAPPAPIGRRVAASLVDGVLTALAAAPLWAATLPAALASAREEVRPAPSAALLATGTVLLLAWGVVQWVCHGTRGWTVGRRLLGLRTVDVRSARPLGLGRALVRSLVIALGALACGVGQLLVLLSPLFDGTGRRRGWHDRVADAVVVDVRGLPAARRVAAWEPVRRPATEPVVAREVPWAATGAPDDRAAAAYPGAAAPTVGAGADPAAGDRPAVAPPAAPVADVPARTRWAALAGERQLDAPGLVLPPLGRPGPGPDLDTRQTPTVPGPVLGFGAGPGAGAAGTVAPGAPSRTGRHAARDGDGGPGPRPVEPSVPTPPHPDVLGAAVDPRAPLPPAQPLAPAARAWSVPATPPATRPADGPAPSAPSAPSAPWAPRTSAPDVPPTSASSDVPPSGVAVPPSHGSAVPPSGSTAPGPGVAVPPLPGPAAPPPPDLAVPPSPEPALPPAPFPAAAPPSSPDAARSWAVRLPDGTVVGLDVPLLVGRNPEPQPGVRAAPVSDPGRSVSKTHLMLGADDHGAWVVDRGSTNGTLVTLADGQRVVCLPDRRVRLTDGSLVAFGDLSLSVGLRA